MQLELNEQQVNKLMELIGDIKLRDAIALFQYVNSLLIEQNNPKPEEAKR